MEQGYPLNPDVSDNKTRVAAPHVELINFARDGVCVFARMVRHKLDTRAAMENLRTTKQSIYNNAVDFLRNRMDFTGASGRVKFVGNDLSRQKAIWQAVGTDSVLAGLAGETGDVEFSNLWIKNWSAHPQTQSSP